MMKRAYASAITLAVATLSAGSTLAAGPAVHKTREQVNAELIEAQRTGNIDVGDAVGRKLNELYPNRYPPKQTEPGKTREQVAAELEEARRTGDIDAGDESGRKLNELFPTRYPPKPAVAGKTREQVLAELREARRTGDIDAGDAVGRKLNELFPTLYPKAEVSSADVLPDMAAR